MCSIRAKSIKYELRSKYIFKANSRCSLQALLCTQSTTYNTPIVDVIIGVQQGQQRSSLSFTPSPRLSVQRPFNVMHAKLNVALVVPQRTGFDIDDFVKGNICLNRSPPL